MISRTKDPRNSGIRAAKQYWLVDQSYEFGANQKRYELINKQTIIEREYTNDVILSEEKGYSDVDLEKCYSLSDPEIYKELLTDYLKIYDGNDALEYVRKRGFPARQALGTKKAVKWAVNDLVDSANYLRFLRRLTEEMLSEGTSKLRIYVRVAERNKRFSEQIYPNSKQKDVAITMLDPDDNEKNICCFGSKDNGPHRLKSLSNESPLVYDASAWKSYGTKKNVFAVQHYLQRAFGRLLLGMQPRLDWAINTDGEWVLYEAIKASTPWQAICYALLQNVTQKDSIKSCRECGKPIARRRTFCGDTCNRRSLRKNGATVNSYPKERKG